MEMNLVCSSSHNLLKTFWFDQTSQDGWHQVVHKVDHNQNGDYLSPAYRSVLSVRLAKMAQSTADCSGQLLAWSDVDIQWFRPAEADLLMLLQEADFLYQRETALGNKVNAGLVVMRATPDVHALLTRCRD